jgi:hypothetical protein
MKFVTSMFYALLLLPLAIFSHLGSFEITNIESLPDQGNHVDIVSQKAYLPVDSKNTYLYQLPSDTNISGAAMTNINGELTGDMLFAQTDMDGNLTGNLVLNLKDSGKITFTPITHQDMDEILEKIKFYDKKNNNVDWSQGNVLAMWQDSKGDKFITQSKKRGMRFTAFQKNEAGQKAVCMCRINTEHQ